MTEQSKRISIFPISYFKDNIENNQELKDFFVDKIVNNSKELSIPEGWTTNKIKTSFSGEPLGKEIFFGENKTILQQRYGKCLDNFFKNSEYAINISSIWYNCYIDGEYQELHCHLPEGNNKNDICHFSCIHFLSFDTTRHKPVRFEDPLYQLRTLSMEMPNNHYTRTYYPDIKEGDFIMFPSYLKHCVEPSQSTPDYPRITISMNINVLHYNNLLFN